MKVKSSSVLFLCGLRISFCVVYIVSLSQFVHGKSVPLADGDDIAALDSQSSVATSNANEEAEVEETNHGLQLQDHVVPTSEESNTNDEVPHKESELQDHDEAADSESNSEKEAPDQDEENVQDEAKTHDAAEDEDLSDLGPSSLHSASSTSSTNQASLINNQPINQATNQLTQAAKPAAQSAHNPPAQPGPKPAPPPKPSPIRIPRIRIPVMRFIRIPRIFGR